MAHINSSIVLYGPHHLQKFKIFHDSADCKHTLVLIHGGAWRDPNNTYNDFERMATYLSSQKREYDYRIIGINYRLSPKVKYPDHLRDVLDALEQDQKLSGSTKYSIVGHSVGATLALQILYADEFVRRGFIEKSLNFDLVGVVFLDGIYDLEDLVEEYGGPYLAFVEEAHVSKEDYVESSPITWKTSAEPSFTYFDLMVVQSLKDELLSPRQTEKLEAFLQKRNIAYRLISKDFGRHNDVYTNDEVSELISQFLEGVQRAPRRR